MSIKAKTSIHLKFCSAKQLAVIVMALKPEVSSPITHRASVDLQVHNCFLILRVDAEDTIALRAAINAYLRWIASTVNVIEVIERM